MEKSLVDKLKEVAEQHYQETGEKVESAFITWIELNSVDSVITEVQASVRK